MLLPLLFCGLFCFSLTNAIALQSRSTPNSNIDLTSPLILPGLGNLTLPSNSLLNSILPTIYPPVTCLTQNIHPTITRRLPVELVDCVAFFPNFILRPNVLENVRWNNSDLPNQRATHATPAEWFYRQRGRMRAILFQRCRFCRGWLGFLSSVFRAGIQIWNLEGK